MADPIATLERFIRKALYARPEDKTAHSLVVYHVSAARAVQVGEHSLRGGDADPAQLAEEIYRLCEDEATELEGVQKYAVQARYGDGGELRRTERCIFRVSGAEQEFGVEPTEQPNAAGLVGQAMRHLEAVMRSHVQISSSNTTVMATMVENLQRMMTDVNERERELLQRERRAFLRQDEIDLRKSETEARHRRQDAILKQLAPLVPAIAARALGQGERATATASNVALAEFMKSLSEEQMLAIAQNLRPEQLGALQLLASQVDTSAVDGSAGAAGAGAGAGAGSAGS
jgi:hypothetical protein